MCSLIRYIIYLEVTVCVGYVSSFCPEEKDYLYGMSKNLITICITLFALYTTISNFVMIQMSKFHDESKGCITNCISSLRRNTKILLVLIAADTFFFVVVSNLHIPLNLWNFFLQNHRIFVDMVVFFTLFYFLYVIYDSTLAFYNLFEHNHK